MCYYIYRVKKEDKAMLRCELDAMEYAATVEDELFEEYEGYEDEDPEDFDLEMGFNPYMGCYDFDC